MKQPIFSRKIGIAALLVWTLFLSSCVELESIRKFAETSAVVGQKFPVLSSDVYGSCTRKYKYRFYRDVNFNASQIGDIDKLQQEANLEGLTTTAPPGAVQAEKDCRRFKEIAPSVVLLNKALVEYMKTMGDLAADDLTSYDKKLDALATAVSDGSFFNDTEVTAGKSLAKFVLDATTNFYRRKKLKTAIETRNGDVKTLTDALKRFVGQNYILALQDEQRQLDNYHKANIQEHQDRAGNADPLAVTSAKTMWDAERQRLQERISAAEAYVKILDNVAQGHQKLYDSRNNLDTKETRQTALQYARAIEGLVEDFRKAF
jgi:hypothetical protein